MYLPFIYPPTGCSVFENNRVVNGDGGAIGSSNILAYGVFIITNSQVGLADRSSLIYQLSSIIYLNLSESIHLDYQ